MKEVCCVFVCVSVKMKEVCCVFCMCEYVKMKEVCCVFCLYVCVCVFLLVGWFFLQLEHFGLYCCEPECYFHSRFSCLHSCLVSSVGVGR